MNLRETNILAMSEVMKGLIEKRSQELIGAAEVRYDRLRKTGMTQIGRRSIGKLLTEFRSLMIEFSDGTDRTFGDWEDEISDVHAELMSELVDEEERAIARKGVMK